MEKCIAHAATHLYIMLIVIYLEKNFSNILIGK